jgi:hypothetical protein
MISHNLGLFERAGERETEDRGRYNGLPSHEEMG